MMMMRVMILPSLRLYHVDGISSLVESQDGGLYVWTMGHRQDLCQKCACVRVHSLCSRGDAVEVRLPSDGSIKVSMRVSSRTLRRSPAGVVLHFVWGPLSRHWSTSTLSPRLASGAAAQVSVWRWRVWFH